MPNPLRELNKYGQSVWYDNLNRELIVTGALQRMVDEDGVSGGTSNPSIFEKAVSSGTAYDEQMRKLVDQGRELPEIYDELTVTDVRLSAETFRPIYDETQGGDGYASLEVSPLIADDTQASIDAAHRLFAALDSPNAMIKIPRHAGRYPCHRAVPQRRPQHQHHSALRRRELRASRVGVRLGAREALGSPSTDRPHRLGGELLRQPRRHVGR
jgi:hypothetical protein